MGEVHLASEGVRLQPRHPKLFLAGDVEVADLGDGRLVSEQPQKVELSLLAHGRPETCPKRQLATADLRGRWIVGRGLRRLTDLALDLLHELLDPGRSPFRLCPLDEDDRALGLLVGEVQLDQTAGHQDAADEDEEDDDIFAKEPPPGRAVAHRRNASARSKIFRGTAMPSNSAVLRFTARSILSLFSTGTSRGRAPRRILATSGAAWTPWA